MKSIKILAGIQVFVAMVFLLAPHVSVVNRRLLASSEDGYSDAAPVDSSVQPEAPAPATDQGTTTSSIDSSTTVPEQPATTSDQTTAAPVVVPQPDTESHPVTLPTEDTPLQTIEAETVIATNPVLNPPQGSDEAIVSPILVNQTQNEEQQIAAAPTEAAKSDLRLNFTESKINTIDALTGVADFTNTLFLNQSLGQQIDALTVAKKDDSNSLDVRAKSKLEALCRRIQTTFRSSQLTVPEDLEQDMEITRGKCGTQ